MGSIILALASGAVIMTVFVYGLRLIYTLLRADRAAYAQHNRIIGNDSSLLARIKTVATGRIPREAQDTPLRDYHVSHGMGVGHTRKGRRVWETRGQFSKEALDETFRHR